MSYPKLVLGCPGLRAFCWRKQLKLHDIATTFMLPMEILCVSCARVMADVINIYHISHIHCILSKVAISWMAFGIRAFEFSAKSSGPVLSFFWTASDALQRVTHHGPPPFMRLVLVHVRLSIV